MPVTLNGRSYDATDFTGANGYGYAQPGVTGVPLFPNQIFSDMVAELAAANTVYSVSPGAAGGYLRSNGAAWIRINTAELLTDIGALPLAGGTLTGVLTISEAAAANVQLVLKNAGTYNTGLVGSSAADAFTDSAAWGLLGGPNNYLTGLAFRVALILPTGVPDFSVVTGTGNLNSTGGIARFTVLQNGDVGIGTVSPQFKLDVFNGAGNTTRVRIGGGGGANNLAFNLAVNSATGDLSFEEGAGGVVRMTIKQAGSVAIAGNVGFNGNAPLPTPTASAAATDLATAITLVNNLRTNLIAYGLLAA